MIRSAWDRVAVEWDQMPEDALVPLSLLAVVVVLVAWVVAT